MQGLSLNTELKIMTILGDSLALVRPEENITEKDIYPYKIQSHLYREVYVISKAIKNNSSTIENSLSGLVYHQQAASASYAAIGLGIVDCSPRLFSKKMKSFLGCMSKIPLIKKIVHRYIAHKSEHRLRYTQKKRQTETSVTKYRENMQSIVDKIKLYNPIEHIFLLTIAAPGPYLMVRSWGIEENIQRFNDVLHKIANNESNLISIVDVYQYTKQHPDFILADGHHISIEVHDYIAKSIVEKIENNIPDDSKN